MSKQINQYTAASTIDAVNDQLLIDPGGTGAYNKINRNTLLGITGSPLGTSDTQSLSNKTIGNTNAITVKDGSFTLNNSSDTSKVGIFSLASVTTATTRTYTLPNASVTLASLTGTETLTNKTITAPTISGGTIDNTTITVDSIAGHSTSTVVTVANLQISNGVLNSAGAVTATSIASGGVQPQALLAGTGTGWAWGSWTPTWTNLTIGNGTNAATYIQTGKTVHFHLLTTFGSSTSMGTGPIFSLPVTASSQYNFSIGEKWLTADLENTGVASYGGAAYLSSSTTCTLLVINNASTYQEFSGITSTVPFTWGTGSIIAITGFYQAA